MSSFTAEATPPFDFDHSVAFLSGFLPCADDNVCGARRLVVGGFALQSFVARVTATDDPNALSVDVEWLDGPGVGDGDTDAVAAWLAAHLSLDDDLGPLYDAASDDPPFAHVVDDLYGYHHVRFPTPFEAACWAALSQRTPMAVTRRLKRALVAACGRIVTVDDAGHVVDADAANTDIVGAVDAVDATAGRELGLFPTPEMVRANPDAARAAVGSERKAKTVLAAAEAFATTDFAELDDEALFERLREIWGFGDWSAEFVSVRGFGRTSRLPTSERRLRTAVATLYELDGEEASADELVRLSERYGPLRGYWAHYIRVHAFRADSAA